jgi:hypothetical protein
MLSWIGLAVALLTAQDGPKDAQVIDLGDGYARVESATYSVEVPQGWAVTEETRWGQRKMKPQDGGGELGVMTAGPTQASWDELYRTSLYFIMREGEGDPTPYEVAKRKDGLEAATFAVLDPSGFAERRYVLVKHPERGLLALSVRVPDRRADEEWTKHFARMVETATFKGD